nr:ATP-binding protein [Methanospirillum stamsii]
MLRFGTPQILCFFTTSQFSRLPEAIHIAIVSDSPHHNLKTYIDLPGILLPGMTIEDVKQGVSKIRNRVLARVFRELDLIEQWGSGFRRILREAEELGLSEPVIEEIGMRVRVTIFLAEQLKIHVTEQVTEQVIRLIHCLKDKDLSVKEMISCLGMSHRPTFMYDYLKPAMDGGFVEMTQPDSPKSPTQKYRLSRKGQVMFLSEKGQNR